MRVIGCQIDIAWEDKAENHRRVQRQLRHLNSTEPVAGALVVLAEMFSTPEPHQRAVGSRARSGNCLSSGPHWAQ